MRLSAILILTVGLLMGLAACAESTPGPAASVSFFPGKTWPATTTSVAEGRVAIVFVADAATAPQVQRLGRRIAALPEVERYAFMSKEAALAFFVTRFGGKRFVAHYGAGPIVSLPMGYWIMLQDAEGSAIVAQALGDDPAMRHDDSPFSGVRTARDFYAAVKRINGQGTSQ